MRAEFLMSFGTSGTLRGHSHKIAPKSVRCGGAKTLRNRWQFSWPDG